MQSSTLIRHIFADPEAFLGQELQISGWIRSLRDQKNFAFIHLNDGTCFQNLQVVLEREHFANYEELCKLGLGSAVIIRGDLVSTPGAQQAFELKAKALEVEGTSPSDYPLQPKRHSPEFLRTIAHLRPRTNLFSAVFRVRSEAAYAIHQFFHDRDFVYVHTPIITASDAEGAGEMFSLTTLDLQNLPLTDQGKIDYGQDFFGKASKLTVSGQMEGECYAQAFRNIYTFGPTFRAEHSNTPRHAAEFWMMEPEIAFADLADVMDLAEDMLKFVISQVLTRCPGEIDFFNKFVQPGIKARLEKLVNSEFRRMTYTEAIDLLQKSGKQFQYPVEWGVDLQTEHERYLTEEVVQGPVFVTDYPKDIKAFYMKANPDGKTVAATDCLVPGIGEIIGGSQREDDLEKLTARMQEMGMKMEDYWWYLELRKYGSTRHGGFGLGFERLIMYLTGVSNIRDVLPFPRTVSNLDF
ncbi:MAG: asparagine--tRNA ligase [Eubacteriales bacterium]|nr:asparagine--tRNA ligase [Clostridiales bacterium]MDY5836183.1 asparagine--tRNA ligase [Eubacteriales bacterium]